ncbi:MAG: flagellar hook protein FlgE [Nitrosomonas sp.]|jgi:flagellar hook protein FlgE|nr:flagellar hook protein FlgE [Nitrosomonas sp.]MBP6354198.1 flagellar hook protein FlgE [Nitrosomonas sp.]MBP9870786.1 flagellar hook protein FlgE [Nitrosomonas sp.]HQV88502.1 flagellar hook protein FlgE [Nitrosomonas sp.]
MSFQQGLSGLNTSSTNLDVIGNNIANVNTVGFKQSQAQFTDVFANSLSGSGSSQVGIGAKVATIAQTFSQGNITQTNNPLDIAINGQGFFRMSDGGAISYSRDGQFRADGNGFITNSRGLNLTGYMADASGNIIASGPTNLKLSTSDLAPKPTSSYAVGVNLDSRLDLPAVATFDATNPQSYNKTTSGTVVDSLGNSHQFALFFQKTAANTWNTFATIDGKVDAAGLPIGVTLGGAASQALQFDSTGAIDPAATPFTVSIDLATINPTLGATSPLDFTLDLTSSTQFGSDFGVNALTQDGYAPGRLAGFSTTADGIIQGNYTNGQTKTIGQIVLANFFNPQGLAPAGDGRWEETADSGQPVVGTPKSGTLGALQSSAVEDANVDLTHELVKMITAQRMYQANAKTIETQDTVLQTLVNL